MNDIVEFTELDRNRCLQLLAGQAVGRMIFTQHALPAAEPVNYLVDGEEIVFRTGEGAKLAAATRNSVVGFEVDEIDPLTHTGWSVLGIGECHEVVEPGRLARLSRRIPGSWAPDVGRHVISIPLVIVTGRKLSLSSWVSDALCGHDI